MSHDLLEPKKNGKQHRSLWGEACDSGNPVGENTKLGFGLHWIVGQEMNQKFVLPTHAFVHGKTNANGSGFTGVDGRRTGNRTGRSAALQEFNTGFSKNL